MGVFSNIQRALDTKLNTLANRPFIAWPNTKYAPTENTAFIRPTLLPVSSDLYTLNNEHRNPGIYQIDVFVPLEKGLNSALSLIDDIAEHFSSDRRLSAGTDTVFIQNISISPAERQEAWLRIYIEINYVCYS